MTKSREARDRLRLAAVGLEAELALVVDGLPATPESVFGSPRAFIRGPLRHRVGTSFQLPTGAAVYFDTGVIELATPVIELERGCIARASRSLWESIGFIRGELDAWESRTGKQVRLEGFSTHYNVSIETHQRDGSGRRLDALAKLLTYILPAPVMLLATNRASTGVGVRPRVDRIEVTADFTPDATLMVAAGSFVAGVIREAASWRSFSLSELERRGLPRIAGFRPVRHTSRKGWLARFDCYRSNPFTSDPDDLRRIALPVFRYFRRAIARVADPFSLRLIEAVLRGHSPSLLDRDTRPPEYEDVGRLCTWTPFSSDALRDRSRLERIVMHALSGDKLQIGGARYTPTGMRGWSRVVFRRDEDGRMRVMPLEDLLPYLSSWTAGN